MKILIAVEGCEEHAPRFDVIRETWAKGYEDLVHFFTGPELGVPDDYLSLPAKTKAICRYSYMCGYDFTLICDTDIYLAVDRALESPFYQHDYYGFVLDWLPVRYCSGPCYWLSRKACHMLAYTHWEDYPVTGHETDEDVMAGAVLLARGIEPVNDPRYVVSIPPAPSNDIISYHMKYHSPYSSERMYELDRIYRG